MWYCHGPESPAWSNNVLNHALYNGYIPLRILLSLQCVGGYTNVCYLVFPLLFLCVELTMALVLSLSSQATCGNLFGTGVLWQG